MKFVACESVWAACCKADCRAADDNDEAEFRFRAADDNAEVAVCAKEPEADNATAVDACLLNLSPTGTKTEFASSGERKRELILLPLASSFESAEFVALRSFFCSSRETNCEPPRLPTRLLPPKRLDPLEDSIFQFGNTNNYNCDLYLLCLVLQYASLCLESFMNCKTATLNDILIVLRFRFGDNTSCLHSHNLLGEIRASESLGFIFLFFSNLSYIIQYVDRY
jgi:hypothetical protein